MKALPAAPLTVEDKEAWDHALMRMVPGLVDGALFGFWLFTRARDSDRRDAELVFERMKWQAEGLKQGYDWQTQRRGWFPSDWGRASDVYLNPL
jgi:hypothetical protein